MNPELSPEVREWVSELRGLWVAAGLSMNQFVSLYGAVDKGTISRYLNGQRVPRESYFLDSLLDLQLDNGQPATRAVREHLEGLQLRALETAHPHEFKVRLANDQLKIAVTGQREAERNARDLEEQIAERNRQVHELAEDKGRLQASQATCERLTREIGEIGKQLFLTRGRAAQAERRCQLLEDLLDKLNATHREGRDDDLEGSAPEHDPAAAARLRQGAQAEGTSEAYLRTPGSDTEEESPPFNVEVGAARFQQAAEAWERLQPESATASRSGAFSAPAIMRIGAARLTAGLDRMPRLDLEAHRDIFGPLPRLSAEKLIWMAEQVDLRGQGGAAFPFARKLQLVVKNAETRDSAPIVVINATESEPGSVKDKMLMTRSPYLILSGAALVAEAIGAEEIVVGVAGNELANRSMEAAIAAEPSLRKLARVVQVPDRFISGESGALVRGINGKRPVPPGRKILASDFGVADLPTLLSNASTFAQLAVLALLGPERFAAVGTPEEPGTVLLSVGGSAAHPAVVEVPTGVPLAAVLDICQAPAGDGVLVGGYHGMWLSAGTAYAVPVSRDSLAAVGGTLGSGVVLPLGDGTCPLGEVSRIAGYLAGESTGQCGPCRLGLPGVARALASIVDGSGGIETLDVARRSAAAVAGRGACSHPDGMTRFVLSALDVFTEDLAAHTLGVSCGRPVRGVLPLPTGPEQDKQQRLIVDWTRCEGHGLCAQRVPELIHLDSQGYPVILNIPVPDWLEIDAQKAVKKCPKHALRLSGTPTRIRPRQITLKIPGHLPGSGALGGEQLRSETLNLFASGSGSLEALSCGRDRFCAASAALPGCRRTTHTGL